MNKKNLILKYFQKKGQLTVKNKEYQKTITSLFKWLIDNDHIKNDRTSKLFPNIPISAKIISKEKGILAGIEEVEYLLNSYIPLRYGGRHSKVESTHSPLSFKPKSSDGEEFKENQIIAQISGKSHEILAYERTVLNILQRMSGIATQTNRLIHIINLQPTTYNLQPFIAATRKTPWMSLDKKAVAVGGGLTHRLNLSDGILIKDNHLKLTLSLEDTLILYTGDAKEGSQTELRRRHLKRSLGNLSGRTRKLEYNELIEVEVESEKQAQLVIEYFNKQLLINNQQLAILLDNFTPSSVETLLRNLGNLYDLSNIIFEASGGIGEKNIKDWAKTGVNILSLGSLTHSTNVVNLSLEL